MSTKGNGSYLNPRKTVEAAREKAMKHILKFAAVRLPIHLPDADEPPDQVELDGCPTATSEPTVCLGLFSCPNPTEVCEDCPLSKGRTEEQEEDNSFAETLAQDELLAPSAELADLAAAEWADLMDRLVRSRLDGMRDLSLSSPGHRGIRAARERYLFSQRGL